MTSSPKHIIELSKTLSYVLRHKPEKFGLLLDAQGWCEVDALLAAFMSRQIQLSRELLEYVVEHNDKKRFSFSADGSKIRANQGHSIDIDLNYSPEKPPAMLYHGTAERFLDSILKQGLQKRRRHHVHLSPDVDTARQVGQRHGKPVILTIQAGKMFVDGYKFFRSANGVWLTDEVPIAYFSVQAEG